MRDKLSPLMVKVKKILDESEDGELFTSSQLTQLVGCHCTYLRQNAYQLPTYSCKVDVRLWYWGKPSTIRELKKEQKKR